MSGDEKVTVTALSLLAGLIFALIVAITSNSISSWAYLTENGYEQFQMNGSTSTVWQKRYPEPSKK